MDVDATGIETNEKVNNKRLSIQVMIILHQITKYHTVDDTVQTKYCNSAVQIHGWRL
jgi:hypothetical protein